MNELTDLLNRNATIELWTKHFIKKDESLVLGIHADWGMGKTFFAKLWQKYLEVEKYPVCYIDAFENDFVDDPFKVITFSIIEQLKNNIEKIDDKELKKEFYCKLEDFKDTSTNYLFEALKLGGKNTLLSLLSLIPFLKLDSVYTELRDRYKEEISKNPYTEEDSYKAYVNEFRNKLSGLAYNDKPLVVIVDELDRCKPSFAVELLEKLKHLFYVKNVIFILLINENELANIISGYYGSKLDGHSYLRKFIDIRAELPEINDRWMNNFIYNKLTVCRNNFFSIETPETCINELVALFDISLRDITQIINQIKYYNYKNDAYLFLMVAILKGFYLKDREIYNKLISFKNVDFEEYKKKIRYKTGVKEISDRHLLCIFEKYYNSVLDEKESDMSHAESKFIKENNSMHGTYESDYRYVLSVLNMSKIIE